MYDVTSLLGGLASVEVEVDEGGEQARGGQQQQHLQRICSQAYFYFPIPTFSILFQPIFHNFTIFWVSEDHSQLFSILCLGESHRIASLASFKATVHCQ